MHHFKFGMGIALLVSVTACGTPRPQVSVNMVPKSAAPEIVSLARPSTDTSNGATAGTESFSSSAYGVAASPRVASGLNVPRGGGRQMVGKPYTVAGRTYYPTADQPKVQKGRASWYGEAFHGRKTANGEVYDMTHLTAAHKTMPLPSYARVTNVANGRSVIVRVNDRGPFSDKRVIDLSKRAAELLDYTKKGTADVAVEYLGPAPLHGQDDQYLIASFKGAPTDLLPGVNPAVVATNTYVPPAAVSGFAPIISMGDYANARIAQAFAVSANGDWKQ